MPPKKPGPAPSALLAQTLKSIGNLTHPDTRAGQVFARAERGLTRAVDRVTGNATYLRVSGALLRRGALLRGGRGALVERVLTTLRLPTPSEVDALRDQLRRMNDEVEALGSQLERVTRRLEEDPASVASRGRR